MKNKLRERVAAVPREGYLYEDILDAIIEVFVDEAEKMLKELEVKIERGDGSTSH